METVGRPPKEGEGLGRIRERLDKHTSDDTGRKPWEDGRGPFRETPQHWSEPRTPPDPRKLEPGPGLVTPQH